MDNDDYARRIELAAREINSLIADMVANTDSEYVRELADMVDDWTGDLFAVAAELRKAG